jgi:bifunctional oligoribonuclease and PAP phosphatase NrnA
LKNTKDKVFKALRELLGTGSKKMVIVTHENPDGDAIGSAIGVGEILQNVGHEVTIITPNDYPAFLQWFSSTLEILIYERKKKRSKELLHACDLLICVDFNDARRAARMESELLNFSKTKVLIDHHPDPKEFCDLMISEPEYSSTAELIVDVTRKISLESHINHNAAEALFTGIMTDTGSFSHNISRPNTFRVVSKLMEYNIDTGKIHAEVYHTFSAHRMKLLGHCLDKKMEIFPEYRSAVIWLSKSELEAYDYQPGDTEGFVNYPLAINNIIFSAIFIEKRDYVKVSFRSKGSFPANRFAQEHFSGGGHRNAAGGEIKLSLDEAVEKFRQLLVNYKHLLLETI